MRLFLASVDSALYADVHNHDNYLTSYWYTNTTKKIENIKQYTKNASILLDSGAYSAWKKNMTIEVDDYIKFIAENEKYLWNYVELDVKATSTISVAESIRLTKLNQKIIEDAGFNSIPVFHANTIVTSEKQDAWKYFEELLEKYEYIFIGGMAGENIDTQKLCYICDQLFYKNKNYLRKFHALGQTSSIILLRYPWYSVDSTSWLHGGISNRVFYLKNFLEIKGDVAKKQSFIENNFSPLLYDIEQGESRYKERIKYNLYIFNEYQKLVTEFWRLKGVVWND